jgi:hypothetical protein
MGIADRYEIVASWFYQSTHRNGYKKPLDWPKTIIHIDPVLSSASLRAEFFHVCRGICFSFFLQLIDLKDCLSIASYER